MLQAFRIAKLIKLNNYLDWVIAVEIILMGSVVLMENEIGARDLVMR